MAWHGGSIKCHGMVMIRYGMAWHCTVMVWHGMVGV